MIIRDETKHDIDEIADVLTISLVVEVNGKVSAI
jgi:hypothetical protein